MTEKDASTIAVAAMDPGGLSAAVSAHFGHCPYFVFVKVAADGSLAARAEANPFAQAHAPGQLPVWIGGQGADVVLAGGMGGGAIEFFSKLSIRAVTGFRGSVAEAVEEYRAGRRQGAEGCKDHAGHECRDAAGD